MVYEARSYADVGELMHAVMCRVLADGWEPDVIVSVESGGRVPADMALVHANTACWALVRLERIRASKYDGRGNVMHEARVDGASARLGGRVLVVDDVLETGDTLRAVVRKLGARPSDIRVAVPFKKSSYADGDVGGCRVYYGEEVPDGTWIIPEWETVAYREAVST